MALYKNCNEIWPPYHALQNQPRCNSLTSLPWHYQTQAFILASVSSICGPSLPGMFFSQISLGHLLHVILVSAQISPQKSLLWSPWLKQPHCSCPISHYPVSFFFMALLLSAIILLTPGMKKTKILRTEILSCLPPVLKHSWHTVGTHR